MIYRCARNVRLNLNVETSSLKTVLEMQYGSLLMGAAQVVIEILDGKRSMFSLVALNRSA